MFRLEMERLSQRIKLAHRLGVATLVSYAVVPFAGGMLFTSGLTLIPEIGIVGLLAYTWYQQSESAISWSPSCPICKECLPIYMSWVCGYCTKENNGLWWRFGFSWAEKCTRCKRKPLALLCPSCRQVVPFVEERHGRSLEYAWHPARPFVPLAPPMIEADTIPELMDEELK